MGSKFNSEVHAREGATVLKLGGVIDEDNGLAALEDRLGPVPLVINLADIDRINSCGVRDWVNWLGRVEKHGARAILVECAPPIVSQINLVHNFTGNGVVKSFYAPYFCPRCEREKLLLLETRDLVAGGPPFKAPTCRCDECDGPMDFDDMEESYFAFLSNAKKVPSDPSVDAVMQEISGGDQSAKLRTWTSGVMQSQSPSQGGVPAGQVAPLPSVPVVPTQRAGSQQSGTVKGLPLPGPATGQGPAMTTKTVTTTPGTPVALAQQLAELAQANRPVARQEPRSPLEWAMIAVLLLTAAGLLYWAFW